ncbi:hypothetical protein [Kordiimonas aestuarii]|uniref:hypothetical protein n=1 Tax=Kordiimonas aestuarii TaxID=1005925 RepID=UPI0021D36BCC|nr:hypothetical protein [Kordiimonas aestuarii]
MRHKLCKQLFEFWQARYASGKLPDLQAFFDEASLKFHDRGVVIVREAGDIFYDYCGDEILKALGADILGQSMAFCYSENFKVLQLESAAVCFDQHVGLDRYSRFWFGHRHKDVEWLLLPARDTIGRRIVLVGMSATFVEHDTLDALAAGSDLIERIIAQDYLTLGKAIDLDGIGRASWAMLDAMGADVTVNGQPVRRSNVAIGGEAAYAARKASVASVLAVVDRNSFEGSAKMLEGLYSFRRVETFGDALAVLRKDRVDVLVLNEHVEGGLGIDLVKYVQDGEEDAACVLLLEPREGAEDTVVKTDQGLVYCLVKPVGDFALRKAVDDASKFVTSRQKKRFYDAPEKR